MKIELTLQEFNVPFSDLIDKERYEVYQIQGMENSWMVKEKEKPKKEK